MSIVSTVRLAFWYPWFTVAVVVLLLHGMGVARPTHILTAHVPMTLRCPVRHPGIVRDEHGWEESDG